MLFLFLCDRLLTPVRLTRSAVPGRFPGRFPGIFLFVQFSSFRCFPQQFCIILHCRLTNGAEPTPNFSEPTKHHKMCHQSGCRFIMLQALRYFGLIQRFWINQIKQNIHARTAFLSQNGFQHPQRFSNVTEVLPLICPFLNAKISKITDIANRNNIHSLSAVPGKAADHKGSSFLTPLPSHPSFLSFQPAGIDLRKVTLQTPQRIQSGGNTSCKDRTSSHKIFVHGAWIIFPLWGIMGLQIQQLNFACQTISAHTSWSKVDFFGFSHVSVSLYIHSLFTYTTVLQWLKQNKRYCCHFEVV